MNKMKHLLRIQLWLLFLCNFAFAQNIPDKPVPPRLVNDFANVLSDNERQSLENKLVAYNDSTSTQIAIVIIQSLEGADVSQYAVDLGGKWGIGGRKNNNGIFVQPFFFQLIDKIAERHIFIKKIITLIQLA